MSVFVKIVLFSFLGLFSLFEVKAEELKQIKDTVTVSYAYNKPLIYQVGNHGTGVYPDILYEIFSVELGLQLDFQERPWKRAQTDIKMGRSDVIVTVPTSERLRYVLASRDPIYYLERKLYTYQGHTKLKEIQAIKTIADIIDLNLSMAAIIGDGWYKENLLNKGVATRLVPDPRNSFRILADKRVDAIITSPSTAENVLRHEGVTEKIVDTGISFRSAAAHILVSKKSKYAHRMNEIDQAIAKIIKDGRYSKILAKYP